MSQQSLNSLAPEFMNKYDRTVNELPYDRTFVNDVRYDDVREVNYEQKLSPEDYKRWCAKMAEIKCCNEKVKECLVECIPECPDPCQTGYSMGSFALMLLWFIILIVIFWLIFYSLSPAWSLNSDGQRNTGKILLASIISALVLIIIIWLIKSCIDHAC